MSDPIIYSDDLDAFISGPGLPLAERDGVLSAMAYARVTGSVGASYNGTSVKRLYVDDKGSKTATRLWLVTETSGAAL